MAKRSTRNNTSSHPTNIDASTVPKPTKVNAATEENIQSAPKIIVDPIPSPEPPLTTKLDQEPNPFEQSFSGASESDNGGTTSSKSKFVLPPAATIDSPSPGVLSKGIFPKDMAEQFAWDSLRSGPLSPSMLQRPADPTYTMDGAQLGTNNRISSVSNAPGEFSFQGMTPNSLYGTNGNPQASAAAAGRYQDMNGNLFQPNALVGQSTDMYMMQRQNVLNMSMPTMDHNQTYNQRISSSPTGTSSSNKRARRRTVDENTEDSTSQTSDQSHQNGSNKSRKKNTPSKDTDDDERRKNFLERNRQAALKCRQRKKQWLNNLQAKVEYLTNDNEQLQLQANALREEIINLKTLLLAHKDCAVAQQNGVVGLNILQRPPGAVMNPSTAIGQMGMSMSTAPSNMPNTIATSAVSSTGPNTMRF
ncbi:unnamed protein product [Umbelopsis vinacea]